MANIFNAADNRNLMERLQKLNVDTRPLSGKMNASQMVLHSQKPLDVAEGRLLLKRGRLASFSGKW